MKVKVISKRADAKDICVLDLADPEGRPLPPFSAGAHIDVYIREGIARQYSLCNSEEDRYRYRIGVLLDPNSRGGSKEMHELAEGALIDIGDPRNQFPLDRGAAHTILVAAGIGITPIICMAESLLRSGGSFEMHYTTRAFERTAFYDRLMESDIRSHVSLYHDADPSGRRLDLKHVVRTPAPSTHLYVCGPLGFIERVLLDAEAAGWNPENVHREYFSAPASQAQPGDFFRVKLARSGAMIDVPPERTIVQALASAGIVIPTSCEQGICGTCLTRVIEGQPDHRDMFLTDEERAANDRILPCCSRSKDGGVLTLDV